MKLVKCTYGWDGYLTEGKIYQTSGIDERGQLPLIADNNERICFQTKHFEDDEGEIQWVGVK
jgi:hypothetical protein